MEINIIISKMTTLVIYMCIGFICAKFGVTGEQSNKIFSKALLNIFLPATIINSVVNITPTLSSSEIFSAFWIMCLTFLISAAISFIYTKFARITEQDGVITRLAIVFINNCFVGIPIAEALFGTEASFYISLSNLPFNLLLYTFGIADLNSDFGFNFKIKDLLSGPMISTILAVILSIIRIHIPSFIAEPISGLSKVTIPLAMIVIGTSIASASLKEIFTDWRIYLTCFVRLIICPVITWLLLRSLINNDIIMGVILVICSCPSAMVISAVSIQYDSNTLLASRIIFMSSILSIFTMPLMLGLLM